MTPWVRRLLLANVAMFVVQQLVPGTTGLLAFRPLQVTPFGVGLRIFYTPWTVITYTFLHGDFFHIAMNMLFLFVFGPRLEARLGGRRFLWLYLWSGIGGAMLSFIFTPYVSIIGASGAVYGVALGFVMFWPNERIYVLGMFPIIAWVGVGLLVSLSFWYGFLGARDGVAHFAHLGGFLAALIYIKIIGRNPEKGKFKQKVEGRAARKPGGGDVARWQAITRENLHAVNREEVDRLLEKVQSVGAGSLTVAEKAFLDRMCEE